jgi:hypothetical protein
MSYRQFIWGLSNGVMALAISGVFWFGMAAWSTGLVTLFGTRMILHIKLWREKTRDDRGG